MQRELPQGIASMNPGGKLDPLDTAVLTYLPFNQYSNSVCETMQSPFQNMP